MRIFGFLKEEKLSPDLEKKFGKILVAENSKRLFILLTVVAIIEVILLFVELIGFLEIIQEIFISQIVVLFACVIMIVLIYYLRKKNHTGILSVFTSIMHVLCLVTAVTFSVIVDISGLLSFGTFYIGSLIVSLTFIRKPVISIIYYVSAYLLLAFYSTLTNVVEPHLISEVINATIFVPLVCIGSFFVYRRSKKSFLQEETITVANKKLKELSFTDELTLLYNRRKIYEDLERERSYARRYKTTLTIILIDIDDFKSINDSYGHNEGDLVLKEFAHVLKMQLRLTDIIGRWGGEEFIILCPNSDMESANLIANRLRKTIEKHDMGKVGNVTFSAGIAQLRAADAPVDLIGRADKGLYSAKSSGRNRVEQIG